jgi:hypothetical protein
VWFWGESRKETPRQAEDWNLKVRVFHIGKKSHNSKNALRELMLKCRCNDVSKLRTLGYDGDFPYSSLGPLPREWHLPKALRDGSLVYANIITIIIV